ncbi:hypothetical protein U1Q18_013817 [Sarracenia purpurea var. burkii]
MDKEKKKEVSFRPNTRQLSCDSRVFWSGLQIGVFGSFYPTLAFGLIGGNFFGAFFFDEIREEGGGAGGEEVAHGKRRWYRLEVSPAAAALPPPATVQSSF